jgi:hypothetical protein
MLCVRTAARQLRCYATKTRPNSRFGAGVSLDHVCIFLALVSKLLH